MNMDTKLREQPSADGATTTNAKADEAMKINTTTSTTTTTMSTMSTMSTTTKGSDSNESPDEWIRLSQWVHCLCVVTFDLNLGQALEYVYPPELMPSEQEVSNICYMAFPDSNSGCMGDTKFHMRLRAIPATNTTTTTNPASLDYYNGLCAPAMRSDSSHYWGFVYFRQKRDANLPRGYFQKSLIIITRLPFFNLYYDVLGQLAPKYFELGDQVLRQACEQINTRWPNLMVGQTLQLPLLDCNYQICIPKATSSSRKLHGVTAGQQLAEITGASCGGDSPTAVKVLASVHEVELFRSLSFVMDHLYTLWELVITAEPIVVVGTSPADCSHMVQALVAVIAPLEYCAESRPYFTIHDSEFKEFTQENPNRSIPAVILGVTNPFFVKLLKDWPHMLRLVDNQKNMQQQQQELLQLQKSSRNGNVVKLQQPISNNHNILNGSLTAAGDSSTAGLHTKYKPYLKKDKTLIKKVLLGMKTKRPEHVQTALIRRYLLELTQSFMIPLERYMASLMPLQKDISPFKSAPNASSFKLDDFLATLETAGPQLTSPLKGDWKGLYRRFIKSPNFRGWYESRHRELQLTLQDLQLQALSQANLEHWAHDKQEVEIIDMILKLKQKLNLYSDKTELEGITSSTQRQIRAQIECMKGLLPSDLKNVVNL
ncbi:protein DENND6B [Drosophila innubila]|uniref:protein DENND6B n=1 Tax=Drosophila innubila TaxID=198719 RepID=UPI00148B860B|nr:protein DENND6B [Drosophila innubila]XP_034490165.1 protein DENND6B [Drosophila innubila]